jgi:hypothetical protein
MPLARVSTGTKRCAHIDTSSAVVLANLVPNHARVTSIYDLAFRSLFGFDPLIAKNTM